VFLDSTAEEIKLTASSSVPHGMLIFIIIITFY
jgi:hypothetical protein